MKLTGTEKKLYKNVDFYKELTPDRERTVNMVVKVTMLLADNDYFNTGLMLATRREDVCRVSIFYPLIGLLRKWPLIPL